jgi:protein ImuB
VKVPCYEDLTPGIPGVSDGETAGNVASLLRDPLPASAEATARVPASGCQLPASAEATAGKPAADPRRSALYACIRLAADSGEPDAGSGQLDAALAVARDFSPRVRRVSEHEILLDVSGLGRLIGPPAEIERQLARVLLDANVPASVAIAPTQTIARLLAHAGETGHGQTCHPASARAPSDAGSGEVSPKRLRREGGHSGHQDHEDHKTAGCDLCDLRGRCAGACGRGPWQQLSIDVLRELETGLKGCATEKMNERDRARPYETLQRWGIATLGELTALPGAELSSRLGRRGVALQRLARGFDAAPFVPDGETPRYVERLELEWPIDGLEPLSFVLARLLEPLSAALERADRGAVAVRVDLRLTDRSTHTRVLQLPAAMRDARVLRTLVLLDLEASPVTAAVDVMTIELDPAPSRITQFSLLERALPSPEALSTLTARLSALVGASRVGSPALVDSHRPDAFVMKRYMPHGAGGAARADRAGGAGADRANGAGGAVLRRQRPLLAIRVGVEHGRPVHIASSRRGIPSGAITQAAGPWRTSGNWWTDSPWSRNEWDVALKSGAVCRVFQDRATGRWFLDGVYD